jgi:hypothetical protein
VTTRTEARARGAVFALFLTNGALFANLIPRYPAIKEDLGLSNAAFGIAVAAFPFGALAVGLVSAALLRGAGSARLAVYGTALLSAAIAAVSVAPSLTLLVIAFGLAGALDAIADVAQNSHGLRVQRLYGRSILNSFHALGALEQSVVACSDQLPRALTCPYRSTSASPERFSASLRWARDGFSFPAGTTTIIPVRSRGADHSFKTAGRLTGWPAACSWQPSS